MMGLYPICGKNQTFDGCEGDRFMAKKLKRQVSQGTKPEVTRAYVPNASVRRVSTTTEFKPDYSMVIHDLKRIGILAGSFIGILVILSFFLQ